jgi:DNA-binding response OmpR family regulator
MSAKRVLVVDDSQLIRQVLADALTAKGFQVDTAENGSDALRKIGRQRPDLVVTDILMPVMDGWALCEAIRRAEPTHEVPFIFLTTERDVPKRIKGLEMGADDYICKPFSKEEVVARVESVMRRVARTAGRSKRKGAKASQTRPGPVHLAGHSEQLAIPDVIQLLSLNQRSGTLHIRGRSVGRIFFREGKILNAETRSLKGRKALFRIVTWPEALFEFEPGEPGRPAEPALEGSTSSVLMESFKQFDELHQLAKRLPNLDERLRATRKKESELGALTTTQRIILRAAAGGATLAEIIDSVPDDDLVAYTFIEELIGRGALEVIGTTGAAATVSIAQPKP